MKAAIAAAAKKVEAVYAYPFQNHAPMEVMNATTRFTPDRCEVWVPTQNGEAAFAATLAASGRPADKCEVYKIHLPSPVPRLAGMDCAVIVRSMQDFKSGQRRPRGDVALHLGLTREALVERLFAR